MTTIIRAKREWSWDDRVEAVCPVCGGDPTDPFTECEGCDEVMQRLDSRRKQALSGEFSPLAQRLGESMKDDMYL